MNARILVEAYDCRLSPLEFNVVVEFGVPKTAVVSRF